MKETVAYSSILQDFAEPLLFSDDTEDQFITKMKVAEVIWNYCIAKEFSCPYLIACIMPLCSKMKITRK